MIHCHFGHRIIYQGFNDVHKYTYVNVSEDGTCYVFGCREVQQRTHHTCMMSRPDENVRLVRRRRDDVSSLQSTYLRQDQGSKKGSKVETEKQHLC